MSSSRVLLLLLPIIPFVFIMFSSFCSASPSRPPNSDDLYRPQCLANNADWPANFANVLQKVPWATVNLDLAPNQRFIHAYAPYAHRLQKMVELVKSFMRHLIRQRGVRLLEFWMCRVHDNLFPSPYREEIEGISFATGVSVADLSALNLFYEFAHLCTSIVAEGAQGTMVHGRNLDFGVMLGWDSKNHGWTLTEHLKGLSLNLNFTRQGRTLFFGTTFVGHIGLVSGMRPLHYAVSINSRLRPGWSSLLRWLSHLQPSPSPSPVPILWAQRNLLENQADFESAEDFLSSVPLLTGCFYVLSGNRNGQGVVLVRNETAVEERRRLAPDEDEEEKELEEKEDGWFLVQRNFRPGRGQQIWDEYAGTTKCMRALGRPRVGLQGMAAVLSSKNTLNKSTVHTTVMLVQTGIYETFTQNCTDPCGFI